MPPEGESPIAALAAWSEDVRAAMRRLDPMQSRIIKLVYFEHRTEQQVAEELHLPRRDVAHSFSRGLQALAVLMLAPAAD